ncbi:hypothetical protein ACPRNU_14155 [Chromobacterium vaccinii]|uniref:hypothetical protein n=1 Tax=Chromobacterium vaccinii TaxID=1108595 RepID=UPI003C70D644
MPTFWLVSGNKGGVGKSATVIGLTSRLIRNCGIQSVGIIDGDGRTPDIFRMCNRKIMARQLDFRLLKPESTLSMVEGDYERVLHGYMRAAASHIVINTPDGADQQLLSWFDSTLRHIEPYGTSRDVSFKFLFVMSPVPDGLEFLPQIAQRFDRLFPVRNLYFGSEEKFTDFNSLYAPAFKRVVDFPRLGAGEMEKMKRLSLLPHEYINSRDASKRIHLLNKQRVMNWDSDVDEELFDVIEGDESNLIMAE